MAEAALEEAATHLASTSGGLRGLRLILAAHEHVQRSLLRGQDLGTAEEEACACVRDAGLTAALLATAHAALITRVGSIADEYKGDASSTLAALEGLLRRDQQWLSAVGADRGQLVRYSDAFSAALASHPTFPSIQRAAESLLKDWLSAWVTSNDPPNVDMAPPESAFFIHSFALGLGPTLDKALDEAALFHVDRIARQVCATKGDTTFAAYPLTASNEWRTVVPAARAFSASHLAPAMAWARSHLASGSRESYTSLLSSEEKTMDQLLVHALLRSRLAQFQALVLSFPSSSPALEDIQICLDARAFCPSTGGEPPDPVAEAAQMLLSSWRESILLPATPTDVLVEFFVLLIHACRAKLTDGGQVLLSHLVPPLRATLRSRDDTIDVVVSALLGKGAACKLLRPALGRAAKEHMLEGEGMSEPEPDDAADEDDSDDDAAVVGRVWKPRPRHAGPAYRRTGQSDVVGLLVSIFTDRQGFVNALERAFATQLLLLDGYDAREQAEGSQALRERFGPAALQSIEMMLLDLLHSKSVTEKRRPSADLGIQPVIVSRQCWPDLSGDNTFGPETPLHIPGWDLPSTLRLPKRWQRAWEAWGQSWTEQSPGQRAMPHWRLGTANVTLTMDDGRVLQFEGLDAAQLGVLELASDQSSEGQLTVQQVVDDLGLDRTAARRAMFFWSAQGVLREEEGDVFVIVEHA